MLALALFLSAFALAGLSGLPGLLRPRGGARLQVGLLGAAALAGAGCVALIFLGRGPGLVETPWSLPHAALAFAFDPIAAWFLAPLLVVPPLLAHYGRAYWPDDAHPESARRLRLYLGLTAAAMLLLPLAANAILFLMAWEAMALLGFLMMVCEDRDEAVRRAGWIYLGAAHLGTLCLFAGFALMAGATGSFTLQTLPVGFAASPRGTATFVLLLLGFGLKAGLVPLHLWLPVAHPAAPSHVSAFLSGLMLKMGVLGLVRFLALVPDPPLAWGAVLLVAGAASAVIGILQATGQRDIKRLLAFSSIENLGIIALGLGLAVVGRAIHRADVLALGLAGALLHVWNHALFKTMLFLAAGAVAHGAGTRDMEHLGGLAKRMPYTAAIVVLGAAAICGLPPLNGFVSEWFLYLAAFRALGPGGWSWAVLAVVALALVGGLAVAAFAKLIGTVFLGEPRSVAAERAPEAGAPMRQAMGVLAGLCVLLGLAPVAVSPLLDRVVRAFGPADAEPLRRLAGLWPLGLAALILLLLALLAWTRLRGMRSAPAPTWDCGYVAPTARMQYTGASFTAIIQDTLQWAVRPEAFRQRIRGLFPKPVGYEERVPEPVLERVVMPLSRGMAWIAGRVRVLQGGQVSVYLLYVAITLIALLAWTLA